MVPDGEVRRQLEAVMARPEIAAQFPGGVVEMLEMMGEGGMEELLMEIVGAGGAGGVGAGDGGMPGQLPGFEMVEDEEVPDLDGLDPVHVPEEGGDEQDEQDEWEEEEPSVSVMISGFRSD